MRLFGLFRKKSREEQAAAIIAANIATLPVEVRTPTVSRCECGSILWFESERKRGTCHACADPRPYHGLPRPRVYPPMPTCNPPWRNPTMTTDADLEKLIQSKNLNAPRVTKESIEGIIRAEVYFTASEGVAASMPGMVKGELAQALRLLTFCVLWLENGFTVTGESACASPENFDAEVGQKAARANAVNKLWALEGYRLKQRLYDEKAGGVSVSPT